jgi:hypothetical protein
MKGIRQAHVEEEEKKKRKKKMFITHLWDLVADFNKDFKKLVTSSRHTNKLAKAVSL